MLRNPAIRRENLVRDERVPGCTPVQTKRPWLKTSSKSPTYTDECEIREGVLGLPDKESEVNVTNASTMYEAVSK